MASHHSSKTLIINLTADENFLIDIRLFGEAFREFNSHHQTTTEEKQKTF